MTKTMKVGAVIGTLAMVLSQFAAVPAYACEYWWCGSDVDNSVTITVSNSGTINNETEAKADTGDNDADGSYGGDSDDGGDGGDGGRAKVEGGLDWNWCECDDSGSEANGGVGGNGGDSNGGNAGPGGLVDTGDASAEAGTVNTLNTVDIEVVGCGCEEEETDDCCGGGRGDVDNRVVITLSNSGTINNETEAKADTGDNDADGSYGGDSDDGGDGGDGGNAKVEGDDGENCDCVPPSGGNANAGGGGEGGDTNGGSSDVGGTIRTGDARSESGTVNLMNTVLIRVTR
ncbi:hypothetical protein HY969_04670 [Candidatus Kaiserbacteria bacterium]|nr:hypothetical protein [Candidatus Kaiserbacteria bacterium]